MLADQTGETDEVARRIEGFLSLPGQRRGLSDAGGVRPEAGCPGGRDARNCALGRLFVVERRS